MTEDEAIKEIKRWTNILMSAGSKCVLETAEAQKMAIDALEEIQKYKNIGVSSADELEQDLLLHKADSMVLNEYKAIGAVEEIKKLVRFLSIDNDREIIKELEELREYVSIGTIEECREAMERQTPQKVITYKESNIADCPICGAVVRGINKPFGDYCSKCGQKLDWSDEE